MGLLREVADRTLPTVMSTKWLGLFNRKLSNPWNQPNARIMTKIKLTTIVLTALMASLSQPSWGQSYSRQIAPGPRFDATPRQFEGLAVPGRYSVPPSPAPGFRPLPSANSPNSTSPTPIRRGPQLPQLNHQPVHRPTYQAVEQTLSQIQIQQRMQPQVQQPTQLQVQQPFQQQTQQPTQLQVQQPFQQQTQQPTQLQVQQPFQQQAQQPTQLIPLQTLNQLPPQIPPQNQTQIPQPVRTPNDVRWHVPEAPRAPLKNYVDIVPPISFQQPQQQLPVAIQAPMAIPYDVVEEVGEDYFEPQARQAEPAPELQRAFKEQRKPGKAVNHVFGFNALLLSRENFNDSVNISNLSTRDVIQDDAVAFDVNWVTRRQNGKGWEARYFGILEETASSRLSINPLVPLSGTNAIERDTEIHSAEFNFVRQQKSRILGIPVSNNEAIFGARAFHFSESLLFQSDVAVQGLTDAFSQTDNLLIGVQIGRRIDKQLFGRLGTTGFGKLGVYNNRADVETLNFSDTKDDVAFIGEFDFAGTYTFNRNVRAKVGYRILAVSDLAIADSHLNTNPVTSSLTEINTTDDLYLAGGYFGFEFVH